METVTDPSASRAQRVAIVTGTLVSSSTSSTSSSSTVIPLNQISSSSSSSSLSAPVGTSTVNTIPTNTVPNPSSSVTAPSTPVPSSRSFPVSTVSTPAPTPIPKAPIGVPVFLNNPSTSTTTIQNTVNTVVPSSTSSSSSVPSSFSVTSGISFWRNNRISSAAVASSSSTVPLPSSSSSSSSSTAATTTFSTPSTPSAAHEQARKAWIRMNENRIPKWLEMLRNWDTWLTDKKYNRKIKLRCRKGLPEKLRGTVWMNLTDAKKLRYQNPTVYPSLLVEPVETTLVDAKALGVGAGSSTTVPSSSPSSSSSSSIFRQPHISSCNCAGTSLVLPHENSSSTTSTESFRGIIDTIERDISRTFPSLEMFHESGGTGQAALFRILIAYSRYDPDVSYCQGMGFIVALFLTYLTEEDAFWLLVSIMRDKKHALHSILSPGLPLVDMKLHIVQGLLNHYIPQLSHHLSTELIHITMYATQWILTVFIYSFPFEIVVRIWDAFLFEGWKMVYRIAICVLQGHEKVFCNAKSFEEIMDIFKRIPYSITATTVGTTLTKDHHPATDYFLRNTLDIADKLINEAVKLPIHQKDVQLLEDEWKSFTLVRHPTCGNDAGTVLRRKGINQLPEAVRHEFVRLQNIRQTEEQVKPTSSSSSSVRPVSWGKSLKNNSSPSPLNTNPNV